MGWARMVRVGVGAEVGARVMILFRMGARSGPRGETRRGEGGMSKGREEEGGGGRRLRVRPGVRMRVRSRIIRGGRVDADPVGPSRRRREEDQRREENRRRDMEYQYERERERRRRPPIDHPSRQRPRRRSSTPPALTPSPVPEPSPAPHRGKRAKRETFRDSVFSTYGSMKKGRRAIEVRRSKGQVEETTRRRRGARARSAAEDT